MKDWKIIAVTVYIVLSLIYITYDFYSDLKLGYGAMMYNAGKQDTVISLVEGIQGANCQQALPVSDGKVTIGLLDVTCLQQAPATTEEVAQ